MDFLEWMEHRIMQKVGSVDERRLLVMVSVAGKFRNNESFPDEPLSFTNEEAECLAAAGIIYLIEQEGE